MHEPTPHPDRRGHPMLVAFVTSLVTTVAVFMGLTLADRRGLLEFLRRDRRVDVEVPSINGVSVEQARELLRARNLLLTLQAERPDPVIPAGKVAGQVPLAGSRAPSGSAIKAFVSTGISAVAIPPLDGRRADDAVEELRHLKLVPDRRSEEPSDEVAAGLVIRTDPPAGRSVRPDSEVTLVISSGPAPRPVPKVLGLRLGRAKKTLEEAGFKVGKTLIGSSDRYDDDVIIKQDPPESTPALPGSAVNLVVND